MQQTKVPQIVHHKARNADVVFLRGADGKRRQVYLGTHSSDEARRRYHEVVAAFLAGEEIPAPRPDVHIRREEAASAFPTVRSLCGEFTMWAEKEFLDASTGEVSREVRNFDDG